MKALSLIQPWADLIILGEKSIECRPWRTSFRGWFLVHASKSRSDYIRGPTDDEIENKHKDFLQKRRINLGEAKGVLVGIANLKDVITYKSKEQFEMDIKKHFALGYFSDYEIAHGRMFGFVVESVQRFKEPIPWKGMQRWFEVPDSVINPQASLGKILNEQRPIQ